MFIKDIQDILSAETEGKYYDSRWYDEKIRLKAKQEWGLQRLYYYVQTRLPHHGPTVVLSQILLRSNEVGINFSEQTLNRVLRNNDFQQEEQRIMRKFHKGL